MSSPPTVDIRASVIVCTHEPRADYLQRVIGSLKEQTLATEYWELIIVDNASEKSIVDVNEVVWHPSGRVIPEPHLGLVNARRRGIAESSGSTLIFVDDDNVLSSDYLEKALDIGEMWPHMGAWGGRISCELEDADLNPRAREYLGLLGQREFQSDQWSNVRNSAETAPFGAGMCVRKDVANAWSRGVEKDALRSRLGAIGPRSFGVLRNDDTDLALEATDLGYGIGIFTALSLTHLITKERLSDRYLIAVAEGNTLSYRLLAFSRTGKQGSLCLETARRTKWALRSLFSGGPNDLGVRIQLASLRGELRAKVIILRILCARIYGSLIARKCHGSIDTVSGTYWSTSSRRNK
jgi:glycosyltransferase involved in cell wall biosynthesis